MKTCLRIFPVLLILLAFGALQADEHDEARILEDPETNLVLIMKDGKVCKNSLHEGN